MAIDTTPSTVATSALQAIPFGSLIGGPLDACIQAQSMAAKTTYEFINTVGFTADGKAKNVIFEYQRDGRIVTIIVPVLVIVPIPYIQVDSITIDFMANISASSSSVTENTETTSMGGELGVQAKVGWGPFSVSANFKANYSSKKDSKATQESKYSVEYTMNVHVGASQSNMPSGLAAVLNILTGSIAGSEPGGELLLSPKSTTISNRGQAAYFEVTVKDEDGLLVPGQEVNITLQPASNGLKLKPIGITPGDVVGTPTATSAKAKSDQSGVVGVTVEVDPSSGQSGVNILRLGASAAIIGSDDTPGPVKTVSGQLNIAPLGPLPLPPGSTMAATPATLSGKAGDPKTFKVSVKDSSNQGIANRGVQVSSDNEAAATIRPSSAATDDTGATPDYTVTLVAEGTASITASCEGQTVVIPVTVTA